VKEYIGTLIKLCSYPSDVQFSGQRIPTKHEQRCIFSFGCHSSREKLFSFLRQKGKGETGDEQLVSEKEMEWSRSNLSQKKTLVG
jgi:hypothetical protein